MILIMGGRNNLSIEAFPENVNFWTTGLVGGRMRLIISPEHACA